MKIVILCTTLLVSGTTLVEGIIHCYMFTVYMCMCVAYT